jgi:hypothetical protein
MEGRVSTAVEKIIGMYVFQVELFPFSHVLVNEVCDRIANHGK